VHRSVGSDRPVDTTADEAPKRDVNVFGFRQHIEELLKRNAVEKDLIAHDRATFADLPRRSAPPLRYAPTPHR
jgi:hypothetical protein